MHYCSIRSIFIITLSQTQHHPLYHLAQPFSICINCCLRVRDPAIYTALNGFSVMMVYAIVFLKR